MSKSTASYNGSNKGASVEDLAAQIETLKSDISNLTRTFGEFGSAKTEEARDAARAKIEEVHHAGREKALQAQLHAEDFMQKQPATALGIAAGVGFLVGLLMTSRR